jgi:uncharacterized protein (UPF0333 family)
MSSYNAPNLLRTARRRLTHGRMRDEAGQAVVEFALVAGLLLLLVFGITQFGQAFNTVNDETHLASEAARYAAVNYNPASGGQSLQQWILSQADTSILANGGQLCISLPNGTPAKIGDPVKAWVTMNFKWQPLYGISKLLHGTIPSTTTLTEQAIMRLEAVPTAYSTSAGGVCYP